MNTQQSPDFWQWVKFGDIAKQVSKRVDPSDTDLDIYVGLEHLEPDNLNIYHHGAPSDVKGQKLLVKKGQIIFGKRRAYQRKVAIADWDCICSAHAMVLEANPKNIIPDFLPFFMQSDVFMSRAIAISEGSLSPTIKWKILAEQKFKMPSLKAQIKLVELFKGVRRAEALTSELICDVEKSLSSFIDGLIIKNQGNRAHVNDHKSPQSEVTLWDEYTLQNACELIIDCKNRTPRFSDSGFPVLRTSNIRNGVINWSEMKYTTEEDFETWTERGKPQKGDLIITREAPIGEVCLVPADTDICMGQRMMLFRTNSGIISEEFLRYFCMSKYFQRQLLALANGSTVGHVRVGDLKKAKILVPAIDIQKRIVEAMSTLESTLSLLTKKEENLKKIRSAFI
ncbi:restriction endonuclease subunit S [Vibrio splendidus]